MSQLDKRLSEMDKAMSHLDRPGRAILGKRTARGGAFRLNEPQLLMHRSRVSLASALLLLLAACDAGLTDTATTADGGDLLSSQNVEVCHATGNATSPYVIIEVPEAARLEHEQHGDFAPTDGVCPVECPCFTAGDLDGYDFDQFCYYDAGPEAILTNSEGNLFEVFPSSGPIPGPGRYGYQCYSDAAGEPNIVEAQALACVALLINAAENNGLDTESNTDCP